MVDKFVCYLHITNLNPKRVIEELYGSQMTSKSSLTMNHNFDLYHQKQNYFDHLTPADVNCFEKKQTTPK